VKAFNWIAAKWQLAVAGFLAVAVLAYRIYSNWQRSRMAELESAARKAELKKSNESDRERLARLKADRVQHAMRADQLRKDRERLAEMARAQQARVDAAEEREKSVRDRIDRAKKNADELDRIARDLGY